MIKLIKTETYLEDLEKLDKSIREQVIKKVDKLKKNPEEGKPLKYTSLRELKIGKYRVLYGIGDDKVEILAIVLSVLHKKHLDGRYVKFIKPLEKIFDKFIKKIKK